MFKGFSLLVRLLSRAVGPVAAHVERGDVVLCNRYGDTLAVFPNDDQGVACLQQMLDGYGELCAGR